MNIKLLVRYFSGEATNMEMEVVEKWRDASVRNATLFNDYKYLREQEDHKTLLTSVQLSHDWNNLRRRMGFVKKPAYFTSAWSAFARVAAVIAVIFVVSAALWSYWNVPGYGRWSSFKTADFVDSLQLPDNSLVFLNQHSSLTYRSNFGENNRDVQLRGEGYFEVTPDKQHPFTVQAGNNLMVEVVGTAFHINASRKVHNFRLNVTRGIVSFRKGNDSRTVTAGNSARVTDEGIEVSPIVSTNYMAWKTGQIVLKNSSLAEIIQVLKDNYHEIKDVQVNTSSDVRINTKFENQPLAEVLKELAVHFDKKFQFNGGVLTISD